MFTSAFYLSLILAVAGCTGLILAGKGKWYGWAIGLTVQPVWIVFGIVTKGYGLCFTALMYGYVYSKNLLEWRRKQEFNYNNYQVLGESVLSPNELRAIINEEDLE